MTESQNEELRELNLLENIESDPDVNQSTLATQLGVAVGTVNWHLKRLIAKGYVKVKRAERKKLRYIITPEGIALRARLAVDYVEKSFSLYRKTRQRVSEYLAQVKSAGYDRVRIVGKGDVADICRLTCLEHGVSVVNDKNIPVLQVEGFKVLLRMEDVMSDRHVLITGGAGYTGSLLTSELLRANDRVTVLDSLLFGGESLVPFLHHPNFHFVKADVTEPRAVKDSLKDGWQKPDAIVHLAAIVGFPACQAVGRQVAWRYNVEATKSVFGQAVDLGVERFVFSSTYSNYGLSPDGEPVTEESPLHPHSLYAETKVASEEFLLKQKEAVCAPLIFRFANLYGLSPRTRFDLIVNQFVLEAFTKHQLIIYQRGYSRSFVHIRDVVRGIQMGLDAERSKIYGEVFNLGTDHGNYSKDDIVRLVLKRMPETVVEYKDLTFGGDMRDITVSFAKIKNRLGFDTTLDVDDGIRELLFALKAGIIRNPSDEKYRNAQFIVQ